MNIYYNTPANWKKIGEIDFSDGDYQFDMTVIWLREDDGTFVYAEDEGCSCPIPFEDHSIDMVMEIASLDEIKTHLESRQQGVGEYDRSMEIVEMIERLHAEGLR